ncbi:MAG TPA: lipoyl(octanoyl) transferase LipB [Nitrospira sp.]
MTHSTQAIAETAARCSSRSALLLTFTHPIGYSAAWSLQQQFHAGRVSGNRPDTLMLLQHLPVYTAGRRTKSVHLKPDVASSSDPQIPVVMVNRGGSVTYHGPGQLVAYPILALSPYASGARTYVHMLEEVLIQTLQAWDIAGHRLIHAPGIWVHDHRGEVKIASIGARIDRGVTLHGLALNVSNDLIPFLRIVPCGLEGCQMTSMREISGTPVSVHLVAEEFAKIFSTMFQVEWTHASCEGS